MHCVVCCRGYVCFVLNTFKRPFARLRGNEHMMLASVFSQTSRHSVGDVVNIVL